MSDELQNQLSPTELSTQLFLADRTTGQQRRIAMRLRERVVHVGVAPKPESDRLQAKLKGLPIGPLVSWIGRFARRAATAKYLLASLSPESVFAPKIREEQARNLTAFVYATMEYQARGVRQKEPATPKPLGENELKNPQLSGSVL